MSNKNKNKRSLSAPKVSESYNELINSINANIRQLDPDEYKFFLKDIFITKIVLKSTTNLKLIQHLKKFLKLITN